MGEEGGLGEAAQHARPHLAQDRGGAAQQSHRGEGGRAARSQHQCHPPADRRGGQCPADRLRSGRVRREAEGLMRFFLWLLLAWPTPALIAGALGWKGVWGSGSALADYLIPIPV